MHAHLCVSFSLGLSLRYLINYSFVQEVTSIIVCVVPMVGNVEIVVVYDPVYKDAILLTDRDNLGLAI